MAGSRDSKENDKDSKDKISARQYMILVAGAICSAFVGTLYSYSHVADEVDGDLKKAGNPSHQNIADTAYYVGFFGQYAAFIPGAIFDNFGPAVTILYGAIVVGLGYNIMGWGVLAGKGCLAYLLWMGIFMAGQGSKGLGFGTMLGTMNSFPASWTATIGGVYLCFDAFSALIAMGVYKMLYNSADPALKCPYKNNNANYFFLLGIFIGCVGIGTFICYLVWYRGNSTDETSETEDNAEGEEKTKAVTGGGSQSDSEVENPSPVGTAETSQVPSSESPQMEGVSASAEETDALLEEKETVKEKPIMKKTNWIAVLGAYLIMFFAESQGLAYNKVIGKAFMSARKGRVGVVKMEDLPALKTEGEAETGKLDYHGDATYMIKEPALQIQFEYGMQKALKLKGDDRTKILPVNLKIMDDGDDQATANWYNEAGEKIQGITKGVIVGKDDMKKALLEIPGAEGNTEVSAEDMGKETWMVSHGEHVGKYDFALQERKHFPIANELVQAEGDYFIRFIQRAEEDKLALYGIKLVDLYKYNDDELEKPETVLNAFGTDQKDWLENKTDVLGEAIKVDSDQPLLYDADKLLSRSDDDSDSKSTKKDMMKNDKFYIGVSFIVGNGVGRLAFGFLSDFTAKRVAFMQKSFYIMALNIVFVVAFLTMFVTGVHESGPSYVIVMTLLMGLTYGGIFTLVTAYFKQICEPKRVGVILGCALIIMATGAFFFGNLFQRITLETMVSTVGADAVGPNYARGFFLLGFILNLLMVPVSGFLFYQNLIEIKGKDGSDIGELMEATDESGEEAEDVGAGPAGSSGSDN